MKAFIRFTALLLLLFIAALAWLLTDARDQLHAPLRIDGELRIEVAAGARLRDAIAQLQQAEALASDRQAIYLELWARLTGDAGRIKSGEYRIEAGNTALSVLRLWVDGAVVLHELQLIEGTRFADALNLVRAHPQLEQTLEGKSAEAIMRILGRDGQHPEGRLFPDTYRFPKRTRDVDFLRRAMSAMDAVLAQEWEKRAEDLPYDNADQALIMASIIEKETGKPEERQQIAGVFVRRLNKGMRLQTDPTIIYGLGDAFDGNLRKKDLLTDQPYNSYTRHGLPPSPICLPGRAAIHAALHPADGDALFFVSRGDGSHQFSATLKAHERAVRIYQLKKKQ
ncbi:MAG: endolytic transglycosylase MltG [Panacagrimonas sp.]